MAVVGALHSGALLLLCSLCIYCAFTLEKLHKHFATIKAEKQGKKAVYTGF